MDTLLMKDSQEAGCWIVGGCDTIKCSWCDGVAISVVLDISLMMGSCGAGHWMGTDEMLMVWVGSEWSHKRQKGVATAVANIFKGVSYWKTPCACET